MLTGLRQLSLNGLSLVTRVRQIAGELGDTLGETGAKSLARQLRTHSANVHAVGRATRALERETAEEIERAAAPLKAYLADSPNPTVDDALKRSLQQLFGGTYGRTQLRGKVADIRRVRRDDGRKSVAFDLYVYRADKRVGCMSADIRIGRGNRLIARHDDIYLDPSVRGTRGFRFLTEVLDREKRIYPELGILRIEHKAAGRSAWPLHTAGFEFNPAFKTYNRDQLMAGIKELLDPAGIGVNEAERVALIEMRSRLVTEDLLPKVREIATMGDRPALGMALLSEGWEGIMHLPPPRPNGSAS